MTRTEGELQALISLLNDEDERIVRPVMQALMGAGEQAMPYLQQAREHREPRIRGRARQLLEQVRLRDLQGRFAEFSTLPDSEQQLLTGALLVAEHAYADLDADEVGQQLDEYAAQARGRLAGLGPLESLRVFTRYFFIAKGFRAGDFADPDNHYLNRVLQRRTGIPITLSLAFILVGQRAGLDLKGVCFPHQYICRWDGPGGPQFIDPWGGGQFLEEADCIRYLETQGGGYHPDFLQPAPVRFSIARVLANLVKLYNDAGDRLRAEPLQKCRTVLLQGQGAGD